MEAWEREEFGSSQDQEEAKSGASFLGENGINQERWLRAFVFSRKMCNPTSFLGYPESCRVEVARLMIMLPTYFRVNLSNRIPLIYGHKSLSLNLNLNSLIQCNAAGRRAEIENSLVRLSRDRAMTSLPSGLPAVAIYVDSHWKLSMALSPCLICMTEAFRPLATSRRSGLRV